MEYNTERNKLIIKEYGRNVQKMIEFAMAIDDYEKRTEAAKSIIRIMSQINPDLQRDVNAQKKPSESSDYWRKLWDHLFIISDYKLDVDSPFPKPSPEQKIFEPIRPEYQKKKIMYRTYGRNMENVIKKVAEYPEPYRSEMSKILANYLKKMYLMYNRDSVNDSLIIKQLLELSDGKLVLPDDFSFEATRDILRQNNQYHGKQMATKISQQKKIKRKKKKIV